MLYETPKVLPLDLTNAEKEDIYLFASLVERMKNQAPNEILEDNQLQSLYRKILSTKPKLNEALNDRIQKYNALIDMNAKISDIMNIYDRLLEQQLRNINVSQQYIVPQEPSDPYAEYAKPQSQYTHNLPAIDQPIACLLYTSRCV